MSVVARINDNHELLLKGSLTENENSIKLDSDGNLKVDRVYRKITALDADSTVSEEHLIDEEYVINESQSMESFFAWFFGIELLESAPNRVEFDNGKDLIVNEIKQNQYLGG